MIGVFDSGYGGLTVLKEFVKQMPEYDYLYLGDNARTPYGTRSFETVYNYTLECVKYLFKQNCELIILACNTASAKALRTIQQNDLPQIDAQKRVLGVIRPSAEAIELNTKTNHVGILGTIGTIQSQSYPIEIAKLNPNIHVYQEACQMWVSLVENFEHLNDGADYFIKKNIDNLLQQSFEIDHIVLACTHFPLMIEKIRNYTPDNIKILSQGSIVAQSLVSYLMRHPEIDNKLSKNSNVIFQTTDSTEMFDKFATFFFGQEVRSEKALLF